MTWNKYRMTIRYFGKNMYCHKQLVGVGADTISTKLAWLTHISLASFLWDIGKQNSARCDAAKCGVPSWDILFAGINFIEKLNKMKKYS